MSISSINSNIAALSAQGNISRASDNASASIARLSSGNRIVKSSDDVAGLAIGTSLQTQVTALKSALNNANQATSLLQVADGALAQINNILQQQKSLALQAGSGSLSDTDRAFLDQQFQGLTAQINQIATSTNFNGVSLLNGAMGTTTILADKDTVAAALAANSASASDAMTSGDSANAIQAFSAKDGSDLSAANTTGGIQFVESDGTTAITDGQFLDVNSAMNGQFSGWQFSNVVYGATTSGSATLSVQIGGLTFTGNVAGGGKVATLHNGNTYINLTFANNTDFSNTATTANTQASISNDYKDTTIMRTSVVQGLDFTGTRLAGAIGSGTNGIALVRTADGGSATISDFQAISSGTADKTELTVDVNGHTLKATNVLDAVSSSNGVIQFDDGKGDTLQIDLTGLTTAFTDLSGAAGDKQQLTDFLSALNTAFSKAGGAGAVFSVGSGAGDTIGVNIGDATSNTLFGGQTLSIATSGGAATASTAIDQAVNKLSAVQANVGALESRFNFASANIQSTIQNEDAARGQFLDTDVSSESTAYATAQVQLQAGIAVLAQANLLPQNLLKLIQ